MYSSLVVVNSKVKLDPYFVTGFIDGEGSFTISVQKNQKLKIGWEIQAKFTIKLHKKDKAILELIQSTLGEGIIFNDNTTNTVLLIVSNINYLQNVIIPRGEAPPPATP